MSSQQSELPLGYYLQLRGSRDLHRPTTASLPARMNHPSGDRVNSAPPTPVGNRTVGAIQYELPHRSDLDPSAFGHTNSHLTVDPYYHSAVSHSIGRGDAHRLSRETLQQNLGRELPTAIPVPGPGLLYVSYIPSVEYEHSIPHGVHTGHV